MPVRNLPRQILAALAPRPPADARPDVTVTEGLFSLKLDVRQSDFDGQGLWLGVDVGNTGTNVVCEEILPAPYALSLRPGARIIDSQPNFALIHAENTGMYANSWGIYAESHSTSGSGRAVYGRASATSGATTGVYGRSDSSDGRGVYGYVGATSGTTYGLYGRSDSSDGRGVAGYATATSGETYNVYGLSDSTAARGVYGRATATSGTTYGVAGRSFSTGGYGMYGWASANSGITYGVYGMSDSPQGYGVFGYASANSGYTYGVRGHSDSPTGYGVSGYANASSGVRIGVHGAVLGSGYGLYTPNNLYVGGSCTGCRMAFIAHNTSGDTLRVGDVVAASGVGPVLQGHTSPVLQVRRATAGDASVLGVVYTRGEFYAASGDHPEAGDSVHPVEGDVAPGDYLLVITSGLAQVRVATGLTPGQRLTLGDAAGVATLAGADAQPGLVFGRAMEAQPNENGLLWAMISVQ